MDVDRIKIVLTSDKMMDFAFMTLTKHELVLERKCIIWVLLD